MEHKWLVSDRAEGHTDNVGCRTKAQAMAVAATCRRAMKAAGYTVARWAEGDGWFYMKFGRCAGTLTISKL